MEPISQKKSKKAAKKAFDMKEFHSPLDINSNSTESHSAHLVGSSYPNSISSDLLYNSIITEFML
jgi:hypothetical protein